jgi:ATP-dependent Clp protease adapter protein ClpS
MNIQLLPDLQHMGPGTGDDGFIVIVFDNPVNTFDEVEMILINATSCARREAQIETWEVHHLGKSVVHHGSSEECERAAGIIRTIGITVEVREESLSPHK